MTIQVEAQDFGMFTAAGNAAVTRIVENNVRFINTVDVEHAFKQIELELDRLQAVNAFSEASDTEVLEQVWAYLNKKSS